MSALAGLPESKPSRRKRAAKTVDRALRGGILAAAVATVGWLLGTAVLGTAIIAMVVATIAGGIYTVARGDKARFGIWALLGIGWAIVLIAHWAVSGHGGFWVGMATWLGVIIGARGAGISKWSLPFLGVPGRVRRHHPALRRGPDEAVGHLVAVGRRRAGACDRRAYSVESLPARPPGADSQA